MGKSQTRRLKEATKRFGREDWDRLARIRARLSSIVQARKAEAGLTPLAMAFAHSAYNGPTMIKRYDTGSSYQQNEATYGISIK